MAGTFLGFLGFHPNAELPLALHKTRLFHRLFPYKALSYVYDWLEAFCDFDRLDVHLCDMMNLVQYAKYLKKIDNYELIVILHSATGDSITLLTKTAPLFDHRRGKMILFIGNEYDLLDKKITFIQNVEAEWVCTQLPLKTAKWLYAESPKSKILEMPAALNPRLYATHTQIREVDIGFIGALYHPWIGDMERTRMIQYFMDQGIKNGLNCDIRFKTIPRTQWAAFLNGCKGIIGAESGTYYLDRQGKTIAKLKACFQKNPYLNVKDICDSHFFHPEKFVSGKCISSRHFEPIGTGTCQILLEGHYNGILKKNQHYIGVKKNLSDIQDAIKKFKDETFRKNITVTAKKHIMSAHTYHHRVETLMKRIHAM